MCLVGPDRDERLILKQLIWNRRYFYDPTSGISHFDVNDDNALVLTHPSLPEIMPEDFAYVIQYLESGSFGIRRPEDENEIQEAFAEISAVWETAAKLGMTDLMEHVINKIERFAPWGLLDVLNLATQVYSTEGPSLQLHRDLKKLLSTDIARNFWDYVNDIGDDGLSEEFIQRLKKLPNLERDVMACRAIALDTQVEEDREGEEGEDSDAVSASTLASHE